MRVSAEIFQSGDAPARAQAGTTLANQIKSEIAAVLRTARDEAVTAGDQVKAAKLNSAIERLDVTPQTPNPAAPQYTAGTGARNDHDYIPPQAVDIVQALGTTLVFCVVGFPLARAFARWIDRRGVKAAVPQEVLSRLDAIEKAVESVAVEVERISKGQRFTTKLLNERSREPAREFASVERDPVVALPSNARRS